MPAKFETASAAEELQNRLILGPNMLMRFVVRLPDAGGFVAGAAPECGVS